MNIPDWPRIRIEELEAENAELRRTIDALSTANHWQVSPPLREDNDQ